MKYFILVFVLSAVVLGGIMSMSYGEEYTCFGKVATIVGTNNDDTIRGTNGDDVIVSLGGNDRIYAFEGDDIICPGPGRNTVIGHGGNDTIITEGIDRTVFFGREGEDTCYGNNNDMLLSCENIFTREQAAIGTLQENPNNQESQGETMVTVILDKAVYDITGKVFITTSEDIVFEDESTDLAFIDIIAPNGDKFSKLNPDQIVFSSDTSLRESQLIADDNTFWLQEGNFTVEISLIDNVARGNQDPADVTPKSKLQSAMFTVNQPTPPIEPPVPTETITVDNPRVVSGIQNTVVTTVEVSDRTIVLIDFDNDQSVDQPYILQLTVTAGGITTVTTTNGIIPAGNDTDIGAEWIPTKSGTSSITVSVTDDSNPPISLGPDVTTSVLVTGQDDFSNEELQAQITDLEAQNANLQQQITDLEARVAALERQ